MVRLDQVSKVYALDHQRVTALKEVNLAVAEGEFVAIVGPSGSGKSTLLNLVAGLDCPTSGSVVVDGQDIASLPDPDLTRMRRRTVGIIFQFFNLLPHLNVIENVALPLLLRGEKPVNVRKTVETNLEQTGLAHRGGHRPHELSGGEQQRVAIARALVIAPKVLLADEPTGNLDSATGKAILDLIHLLAERNRVSVLLATHSQQASTYAHRLVQIQDGTIADHR